MGAGRIKEDFLTHEWKNILTDKELNRKNFFPEYKKQFVKAVEVGNCRACTENGK